MSDFDERREHHARLVTENKELIERLSRQGVQIDGGSVLALRLNLLLDHLLPPGTPERVEWDIRLETVFGESLGRAEVDVNRARLTQGISLAPAPPTR